MSDSATLKILNLAGELDEEFKTLLESFGADFIQELNGEELWMILVKNYDAPWSALETQYQVIEKGILVISLSEVKNKKEFYANGGRLILAEAGTHVMVIRDILARSLRTMTSVNLEGNYGASLENFNSLKVTGHFNSGFVVDGIVRRAFDQGFNFSSIRSSMTSMITYFGYLAEREIIFFPLDCNFGTSPNAFVVEMVVNVKNFISEYILEALGDQGQENVSALILNALKLTNFLNWTLIEDANKLVVSLVWYKSNLAYSSMGIFSIHTLQQHERRWKGFKSHPEIDSVRQTNSQFEVENGSLPGKHIEFRPLPKLNLNKEPAKLDRIIEFAQNAMGLMDIDSESLTLEKLHEILQGYPNKKVIAELSEKDHTAILNSLKSVEFIERMKNAKRWAMEEINKVPGKKQDFFDGILNRISGMELNEVQEFIRVKGKFEAADAVHHVEGGIEDLSEEAKLVKGTGEANIHDETVLIKGGGEGNIHDEVTIVKGQQQTGSIKDSAFILKGDGKMSMDEKWVVRGQSFSPSDNKQWNVKKVHIVEKLKQAVSDFGEDADILQFRPQISKVLQEELEVSPEYLDHLSSALFDEMSLKELDETKQKEIVTNIEDFSGNAELEKQNDLFKDKLEKKDGQILRMKKIIDNLKEEVLKKAHLLKDAEKQVKDYNKLLKEVETDDGEAVDFSFINDSIKFLREELATSKFEIEQRDKRIELMEKNGMTLDANKTKYIRELENKVEMLNKNTVQTVSEDRETNNRQHELERENKSLSVMLKNANGRMERLMKGLSDAKEAASKARKTEIENMTLQSSYQSLKTSHEDLQSAYDTLLINAASFGSDENSAGASEQGQSANAQDNENKSSFGINHDELLIQSLQEKDLNIAKLSKDQKSNEEKLKAVELDNKRLEQKLKMTQAQLDAQRKDHRPGSSSSSFQAGGDAKAQHKIKQLESVNQKLTDNNKTMADDMNEKKKELLKMKQEITTMQNTISTLERKLSQQKAS